MSHLVFLCKTSWWMDEGHRLRALAQPSTNVLLTETNGKRYRFVPMSHPVKVAKSIQLELEHPKNGRLRRLRFILRSDDD